MANHRVTRRQKNISRLLREKRQRLKAKLEIWGKQGIFTRLKP